jgi:hypothetical protein
MRASALACLAIAVALGAAGCGDAQSGTPPAGSLRCAESSWIAGQPALTESAAYLAVAGRAQLLGDRRLADRGRTLDLIDARRVAAAEHARKAQLRRFAERRKIALARYREALRIAARKKRALERQRRQRLAAARREREALLRKLRVPPGQECEVPEIRAQFDCVSGQLPSGE